MYATIEEEVERTGGLSLAALCGLTGASRAGFYRFQQADDGDPHMDLRDRIQRTALEWPAYGYRRITAALRRGGVTVNHKLVLRLMREDNLLCVRRRKFVHTTDSAHGRRVYPNLAESMTVSGVDQLWIADITYIRLLEAFVYLAVILDAYSRRILGWALQESPEDELSLAALRMALAQRRPAPGAIHHSDRGVQYASTDYVRLLKEERTWIRNQHEPQGQPLGEGLRFILHLLRTANGILRKTPPFGEPDTRGLSRGIRSGILI